MTSKIDFRPLENRALIEPIDKESKTKGGIYIPDTAKEKPQEGRVLAVGKGRVNESGNTIPMTIKVGDTVIYGKWSGTEIEINDKKMIIMREEDILGVM